VSGVSPRIADLAEIVHARENPWKVLALLRAYFDDAGTHRRSEVTSIGGLIGTAEAWTALEADWGGVLDRFKEYGLKTFHAYDCEVGEGEFARFPREIREAISQKFSRVVADHKNIRIFWSSVVNADWREVADDNFRDRYKSSFGLCFEWCVQQAARWSINYSGGSPIALIFSEQNDFRDRMNEVFNHYVGAKHYAPLRSLTFASYVDCLPLQAADLVATEMNRYWRAAELNPRSLAVRQEVVELTKGRGLHLGGCYDRVSLSNAVSLYRENCRRAAEAVANGDTASYRPMATNGL
jgi:hypothetical protein